MPTLHIQEPGFRELLSYEPMLKQLSPIAQLDDLNAFLIYWKATKTLTMIVREPLAFVQIEIPAKLAVDWGGDEIDLGIAFNYQLFFQTLHAYPLDALGEMQIAIEWGEKSMFRLRMKQDRIALPHVAVNPSRIEELRYEGDVVYPSESIAFQLSMLNDEKPDFMQGLENCMDFVSPDERKNNAFALYNDRMVVNDLRHVFIYNLNHPNPLLSNTEAVSLHKRSAKLFITLFKKGVVFDAAIARDGKRIFLTASNLQAILNNAISNIAPPSAEEIQMISPATLVASQEARALLETSTFFSGFYKSSQEYKSLRLEIEKEGLHLQLKDDGVSDFSTCNVDRRIACETNEKSATVDILNDSLLSFLGAVSPDEQVQIFLDDQPSLLLMTGKRKIFMSKLGG